jgi:hypothetical protein
VFLVGDRLLADLRLIAAFAVTLEADFVARFGARRFVVGALFFPTRLAIIALRVVLSGASIDSAARRARLAREQRTLPIDAPTVTR